MSLPSFPSPFAVLAPCSSSHPFEERRIRVPLVEEQAVKIGRAVARIQPAPNNAIFDCKVLSRNHAVLWYNAAEGAFFIRDTKSSNGTFVNNERLSNSGEESEPRILRSGDILQLGVEIIDNVKKVASGCIMCIVELFYVQGRECADASSAPSTRNSNFHAPPAAGDVAEQRETPAKYTMVRNDKLFVMEQYVKEARFRENLLGQKLQQLEEQLESAQDALKTSWHALINEEQLLSRIEILESQLAMLGSRNSNLDNIRLEIQSIHEDRAKAEVTAKDTLRKVEEQLFETNCRLNEAEGGLVITEEENSFLRTQRTDFEVTLTRQRNEHEELMLKYNELLFNFNALETALKVARNAQPSALPPPPTEAPTSRDSGGTEFRVFPVTDEPQVSHPTQAPTGTGPKEGEELRTQLLQLLATTRPTEGGQEDAKLLGAIKDLLEEPGAGKGPAQTPQSKRRGIQEQPRESTFSPQCSRCGNAQAHSSSLGPAGTQTLLLSTMPLLLLLFALLYPLLRIAKMRESPKEPSPDAGTMSDAEKKES